MNGAFALWAIHLKDYFLCGRVQLRLNRAGRCGTDCTTAARTRLRMLRRGKRSRALPNLTLFKLRFGRNFRPTLCKCAAAEAKTVELDEAAGIVGIVVTLYTFH